MPQILFETISRAHYSIVFLLTSIFLVLYDTIIYIFILTLE